MDILVQRWDNFLPKGLAIIFLLLEGGRYNCPFTEIVWGMASVLLNMNHNSVYQSASMKWIQHRNTSWKYLLAAARNPLHNCFWPPPFTCSATSLFALSLSLVFFFFLNNILHVGYILWFLFSLLTIGCTIQFQSFCVWQKLSVLLPRSFNISEHHKDSRTFAWLLSANIRTLSVQFSHSVMSNSVTPRTAASQASLSITNFWSLLKFMSIELMMPSNHLILCYPLLLLPSIFPSIRVFSNESVLCIR